MKRKPYMVVKGSEWNQMPERTKQALAALAKHLTSLTPEELDRIKNQPFIESQSRHGEGKKPHWMQTGKPAVCHICDHPVMSYMRKMDRFVIAHNHGGVICPGSGAIIHEKSILAV